MDSNQLLLRSMLTNLELHVHSMHRNLLLVMIPEENLEHALYLAIRTLWCLVLPYKSDLDVDIFVNDTFVALDQGVQVKALKFLFQKLLLKALLELSLHRIGLRSLEPLRHLLIQGWKCLLRHRGL